MVTGGAYLRSASHRLPCVIDLVPSITLSGFSTVADNHRHLSAACVATVTAKSGMCWCRLRQEISRRASWAMLNDNRRKLASRRGKISCWQLSAPPHFAFPFFLEIGPRAVLVCMCLGCRARFVPWPSPKGRGTGGSKFPTGKPPMNLLWVSERHVKSQPQRAQLLTELQHSPKLRVFAQRIVCCRGASAICSKALPCNELR